MALPSAPPRRRLRVAVVGAGVNGIAAAKAFRGAGHQVVCYEARAQLGGVWAPASHYPGLRLQAPRELYVFPDTGPLPPPEYDEEYPTAAKVYAYLKSYADKYGVTPCIQYNTRLVRAEPLYDRSDGGAATAASTAAAPGVAATVTVSALPTHAADGGKGLDGAAKGTAAAPAAGAAPAADAGVAAAVSSTGPAAAPVGWRLTLRTVPPELQQAEAGQCGGGGGGGGGGAAAAPAGPTLDKGGEGQDAGPREWAEEVDVLIIASGSFDDPKPPAYKGVQDFLAAGGEVLHTAHLRTALRRALAAAQTQKGQQQPRAGASGGAGDNGPCAIAAGASAPGPAVVTARFPAEPERGTEEGTEGGMEAGTDAGTEGGMEGAERDACRRFAQLLAGGRRVVVVGNGKSGDDVAAMLAASGAAASVTHLCRRNKWAVPRAFAGLVSLKWTLGTRAGVSLMRPLHPRPWPLGPLWEAARWPLLRLMEAGMRLQQGLAAAGAVPPHPLDVGLDASLHVEPPGYFAAVHGGRLQRRLGAVGALEAGAVVLGDGSRLEADLLILATGFRRSMPFLPPDLYGKIVRPDGTLDMYHAIYPHEIGGRSLFVLGWNPGLYGCLIADIAARWVLEMAEGRIRVSREQMRAYNERLYAWADAHFSPVAAADIRSGITVAYTWAHVDDMLHDMGASFARLTPWERLRLYCAPVAADLYTKVKATIPSERP
ncbi:hypothetical protein HYH03_002949 [Edaphochlamys debaryana]|uniref:Flavin-containing monooxygenase n=1 Tax=Edaphochlamys debaryana TaxID=47281 RepID=A0A836C521_9CHLO|nr:hypothetical protein HYH03_002949 [Edaphochlamys debaryana]|eukprot:KAG2499374.1 hypothetical protein HYH03_002949 [Edaphochlamys debaryana]